jgi:uncharacterized membrane protein YhiD involved in acid resistance
MIVTVYQNQWMSLVAHDAIRTDPTRMAQGIMTGIGFLGAGVIVKDGAVRLDGVIFSARGILLLAPPGCDG